MYHYQQYAYLHHSVNYITAILVDSFLCFHSHCSDHSSSMPVFDKTEPVFDCCLRNVYNVQCKMYNVHCCLRIVFCYESYYLHEILYEEICVINWPAGRGTYAMYSVYIVYIVKCITLLYCLMSNLRLDYNVTILSSVWLLICVNCIISCYTHCIVLPASRTFSDSDIFFGIVKF